MICFWDGILVRAVISSTGFQWLFQATFTVGRHSSDNAALITACLEDTLIFTCFTCK